MQLLFFRKKYRATKITVHRLKFSNVVLQSMKRIQRYKYYIQFISTQKAHQSQIQYNNSNRRTEFSFTRRCVFFVHSPFFDAEDDMEFYDDRKVGAIISTSKSGRSVSFYFL